jgi:hypothetical protein
MPAYWLKEDDGDFNSFFGNMAAKPKNMKHEDFLAVTTEQISLIRTLFDKITEEDLIKKEVTYPWGGKAPMGEAIMATSVKWLAAYKLQLLLFIKLCSDQKLGTGDAWVLTEIE